MPYLRATMTGDVPGCKLSAAISRFCSAVQRRRRSRPVITSMRRLRVLVRSVVGVSSDPNVTAITLSSFFKDDRWHDFHPVAQCAGATSLTSRQIFLRFFLDARMENFLRGHLGAFAAWNGIPRIVLYDNLRSAVLERHGDAIRFNPALLDFAAHYRYEPRPVAVARGNEKGRVERAIRFVRDAFFAARTFKDIDDLNAQADAWCRGQAADRRCPEDHTRSVAEVFAEEVPQLLKQPDNPYAVVECVVVKAGKTPYVRFDLNDYSVPHSYVRRTLTVLADTDRLRIVDGQAIVASHPRSFDKGQQIEDPAHVQALVRWKRRARRHRATDRLAQAAPSSQTLLVRAAERGANLGSITVTLVQLLERYGASQLDAAIVEALERDVPHPNAVRLALERRRDDRQQAPPVALTLPAHVRARDKTVQPHSLETYDQLKKVGHEKP